MPFRYISRRAQVIKSFYSGIGKTAVLFPAAFLACVAGGMLSLGMVFYLREIHNASTGQIGGLIAVWGASYVVGCLVLRPLTDSILPRYLLAGASFCICLLALAIHLSGSLVLSFVFYGLIGLTSSLFWPPLMGWLSVGLEGAELGKVMSRFNVSWSMGGIVGPCVAGWLSGRGAVLPIYGAAALSLLCSFLIAGAALALPRVREDRHRASEAGGAAADAERSTRLRYSGWVGVFTTFAVLGVIASAFPVSANEDLHISKVVIGVLLLGRALSSTIGFAIMGRTTFWHYKGWVMVLGQAVIAAAMVGLVYERSPWTIGPLLVLIGFLMALSYFSSMFHGMAGSAKRASRSALHESLLSAGIVLGALAGGMVYERWSISAAYVLAAGIVLAGAAVQAAITVWARRVER